MKIRNGFVSNSSSSSFCIWGVAIDECDFSEIAIEKNIITVIEAEDLGSYEILERLFYDNDEIETSGLEYWCPEGYEAVYIGTSFASIKDNETGKEFKDRISKHLKKIFGDDHDCEIYKEAYYN